MKRHSVLLLSVRAERESLESALFDGQELISSLETDQTRLEGEKGSLQQANEALTCEYLSGSLWPPKNCPLGAHISDIPEIYFIRRSSETAGLKGHPLFSGVQHSPLTGRVHIIHYLHVSTVTVYCIKIIQVSIMISYVSTELELNNVHFRTFPLSDVTLLVHR